MIRRLLQKKSRGQAIVEFTLMLPIIIVLVGGLTDFGLAFFVGIATQNAVREGARVAATTTGLGANNSTVASTVTRGIPDVAQFPATELTVTNTAPTGSATTCDGIVTVQASGTYHFAFLKYISFNTQSIIRSATMRYEAGRPLCT